MKKQGKIKYFGFSFHDSPETLEAILKKQAKKIDFVQLQINYADWYSKDVQSKKCYDIVRSYNKPIIVMEPVKGGALAKMHPEIELNFKKERPNDSVASWAMRYVLSLEGILTVLSGMSSLEQMKDNIHTVNNLVAITEKEMKVIDEARTILESIPLIQCTDCKYCIDGCPVSIKIPNILKAINLARLYSEQNYSKSQYKMITNSSAKASDCIACGKCESVCPQHIKIIDSLEEGARLFE